MSDDELRGSAPVYTAKDLLVSLDKKVGEMDAKLDGVNTAIQIILSQNLNDRLVRLESGGSGNARRALDLAEAHEKILQQLSGAFRLWQLLTGGSLAGVAFIALKVWGVL